jgi:hypothetical protein
MSPELSAALDARQTLMEARAMALADKSVEVDEPWLTRLGPPPRAEALLGRWLTEVRTVAAYRDRYEVDTSSALDEPRTEAQTRDAAQAHHAIRGARVIAQEAAPVAETTAAMRVPGQIID